MMDKGTLLLILFKIRIGGFPPTVGYRISQDQFDQISEAIEDQIKINIRVSSMVEKWKAYRKTWKIKIDRK